MQEALIIWVIMIHISPAATVFSTTIEFFFIFGRNILNEGNPDIAKILSMLYCFIQKLSISEGFLMYRCSMKSIGARYAQWTSFLYFIPWYETFCIISESD